MTRRLARVVGDVVDTLVVSVVMALYAIAYAVVGYCLAVAIEESSAPQFWVTVCILSWVAVGSVALTLWTLRVTGLGARVVIREHRRRR